MNMEALWNKASWDLEDFDLYEEEENVAETRYYCFMADDVGSIEDYLEGRCI